MQRVIEAARSEIDGWVIVCSLTGNTPAVQAISLVVSLLCATAPVHDPRLEVDAFSDSLALPWTQRLDAPVHPGLGLGLTVASVGSGAHHLIHGLALAATRAGEVQQTLRLLAQTGYRASTSFGLEFELLLSVGLLEEFFGASTYQVQPSGSFSAARVDGGRPQLFASLGAQVGFSFAQVSTVPLEAFVRYEPGLQFPYAPTIPVMPHVALMVGLRYHFEHGAR